MQNVADRDAGRSHERLACGPKFLGVFILSAVVIRSFETVFVPMLGGLIGRAVASLATGVPVSELCCLAQ